MNYKMSPSFSTYIWALFIIFHFSLQYASAQACVLDMTIPSSWTNSQVEEANWGGFLTNKSCGLPFERYLYALAKNVNKTGKIFLNITEQNDCLTTLQNTSEKSVILSCGIERLTSGNRRYCSNYSVTDVDKDLGISMQKLDEDCMNLGSIKKSDDDCKSCFRRWDMIYGSSNTSSGLNREDSDICRFSILVSLMSRRINDVGWINSIYACLGSGTSLADEARREGKKISFQTGIEILVGGVVLTSVIVAIVCRILLKKRTKTKPSKEMDVRDSSFSEESRGVTISLREVRLATDSLSQLNFLGQGVAGKVYKGILSNGQHVAVKHIINDGQMKTFVREVTCLSHVKHPNLVGLLGHCDGEDESFLVYELCDNGNLSEWLFGKHKFLTWIQRLEIAIDCARGLWFLHTYPQGCIVHRDVKPTNILLCTNFEAKLSDFGLSKVICNAGVSYVSSEVRGTFGYVDPEYQKNRHVHSSTDVYSFGIVLLQLLSGQRVINMDLTRPMPLSKMARNLTRGGDITVFADSKLDGEYSIEAFQLMFKLALSCIGLKQQRPNMEKVVAALERAHRISNRVNSVDFSFQSK